jgi:hypothetical protein
MFSSHIDWRKQVRRDGEVDAAVIAGVRFISIRTLAFLSTLYHHSHALSAGRAAQFSRWILKRRPT